MFIKEANLANFADENTNYTVSNYIDKLINLSENLLWLVEHNMFVNPKNFKQLLSTEKRKSNSNKIPKIKNIETKPKRFVIFLGIEMDGKLNFVKHVSNFCKKSNNQSNAVCRMANFLGQKENEIIINTFVHSNFNYCPLIWHCSSQNCLKKVGKVQ